MNTVVSGERSSVGGSGQVEAAVERDLPRSDPEPVELGDRVGQQRVLGRVPDPARGGRISPRAPRRVFSVTSAIWETYPNSCGLPSLPLRIGLASGSEIDTSRSVIGSPASRWRICRRPVSARSASSSSRSAAAQLAPARHDRAPRRAPRRQPCAPRGSSARPARRSAGQARAPARLRRRSAGAADRAADQPQPAADRPRAIPHPPRALADQRRELARPRARAPAPRRAPAPSRSDSARRPRPRSSRSSPPAAANRFSRLAFSISTRVISSTTSAPSRRVSLRTVDSSGTRRQRDPAEAAQMQRVRHLAHQRLIAPAGALLDHHQPHKHRHRDRRPPPLARCRLPAAAIGANNSGSPNSTSSPARSSGSSRTSTGNASSHNDSTCPPDQPQHPPPPEIAQHAGKIVPTTPDGTRQHYFRGK